MSSCFSSLMVSRFSSTSCEFGGLTLMPDHVHLPCMSPPAAAVGISSPLVSCPISQSHGGAPDTVGHLRWCWWSMCRPSAQLSEDQIVNLSAKFLLWQCHFSWTLATFCSSNVVELGRNYFVIFLSRQSWGQCLKRLLL